MSSFRCMKILSGLLICCVVSTASAHATFKLPKTVPYGIHDIVYTYYTNGHGATGRLGPGGEPLNPSAIEYLAIEPLNNHLGYMMNGNIYEGRYDDYLTITVRCGNGATINRRYTYSELEQSIFIGFPIPNNCQDGNVYGNR